MAQLARELDRLGVVWHEGVQVEQLDATRMVARRVQGPPAAAPCHGASANGPSQSLNHAPNPVLEWAVDVCVDARGVGSKAALPQLRGVRGEVLRVECKGVQLQRPVRLMHPRYQLYVAPRPDHVFVVGATELESEDTGAVTLRSMLELGSALYSLHPAFGEARVERLSAALRPALDNDQPACLQQGGVWHLNGLYRHGYLCAPALVETLVQKIQETTP
jgi:glycine oxidase